MKELTTEEFEAVIKLLTQLKSYLLSGETFDFPSTINLWNKHSEGWKLGSIGHRNSK